MKQNHSASLLYISCALFVSRPHFIYIHTHIFRQAGQRTRFSGMLLDVHDCLQSDGRNLFSLFTRQTIDEEKKAFSVNFTDKRRVSKMSKRSMPVGKYSPGILLACSWKWESERASSHFSLSTTTADFPILFLWYSLAIVRQGLFHFVPLIFVPITNQK